MFLLKRIIIILLIVLKKYNEINNIKSERQLFKADNKEKKSLGNNLTNFRKNKKRIIVKNELAEGRKRANTILNNKNTGNLMINHSDSNVNSNDSDNMSEQINFKTPINKSYLNNNSNVEKNENDKNNLEINRNKEELSNKYFNKNKIIKTNINNKDNKFVQKIADISEDYLKLLNKNRNIIKKNKNGNLLRNELNDKYYYFLKKNYIIMSAYQMFSLYSSFNEECDYFLLKQALKKWKMNN